MLYYNSKWYDMEGEVTVVSNDPLYIIFSNGQKYMTCEIYQKIHNYNTYEVEQIKAKIEYNRRFNRQ